MRSRNQSRTFLSEGLRSSIRHYDFSLQGISSLIIDRECRTSRWGVPRSFLSGVDLMYIISPLSISYLSWPPYVPDFKDKPEDNRTVCGATLELHSARIDSFIMASYTWRRGVIFIFPQGIGFSISLDNPNSENHISPAIPIFSIWPHHTSRQSHRRVL